jgi:hypothetical protein
MCDMDHVLIQLRGKLPPPLGCGQKKAVESAWSTEFKSSLIYDKEGTCGLLVIRGRLNSFRRSLDAMPRSSLFSGR